MKKQLLLFAHLLFLLTQAKAQTSVYHAFPDSNAYWSETTGSSYNQNYTQIFYSIYINGDTMIGGKIHHKLYENGYDIQQGYGSYDMSYFSNVYFGAIWQDTTVKQVFFVPSHSTSDTLLYDFNLSLGESLPASFNNNTQDSNYVSSIDSILIGNDYRKRFWISGSILQYQDPTSTNYVTLIEGIGSTYGLENRMQPLPGDAYAALNCFSQNGQTLWPDSSACSFQTSIMEASSESSSFLLFPNPATNQITIHTSSFHNEAATVSVINILGEIVQEEKLKWSNDININIKNLCAGIYFLQLKSESGSVVRKFVKE